MPSTTATGFCRCGRCNTPNPSASYLTRCLGCGRPIPPYPTSESTATPSTGPEVPSARPSGRGRKTLISSALYAGVVLASIVLIRQMARGWWLVAGLALMPRWLFLLPVIPMAVGAIRSRRTAVCAVVLVNGLLILGPLMGFSSPVGRWFSTSLDGSMVRVMTVDPGEMKLDAPRLIRSLERHRIDVVCFQEPGLDRLLEETMVDGGWRFDRDRRVASRFPIVKEFGRSTDRNRSAPGDSMTLSVVKLKHPDGFEFLVGSVHLPKLRWDFGRLLTGDFSAIRTSLTRWDEEVVRLRERMADSGSTPMIVAGDFHMPGDYHAMAALRASYPSAFEEAGWGYGYNGPAAFPWVRGDHVVASHDWSFRRSWIGPGVGSGRLPVIAEAILIDRKPAD